MTDARRYLEQNPQFGQEAARADARRQRLLSDMATNASMRHRDLARCYLRDPRVRLSFAWAAVKRKRRFDLSPDAISRIAASLNPFQPEQEPVSKGVEKKWGRRPREVCRYGVRRYARQRMVASLIDILHPLPPSFFYRQGVPAARRAVEELVLSGHHFGAELDVVKFYPSINGVDELKALLRPLPGSVVECVVLDSGFAGCLQDGIVGVSSTNLNRRMDLSTGSASSPLAGEIIMRAMLQPMLNWPMVVYHDNVFVFGRSQDELASRINALREAAERQTVGRLRFAEPKFWAFPSELTFLGGVFRLDESHPYWQPSRRNEDRYLWACDQADLDAEQLTAIIEGLPSFRRAYPQWWHGDFWCLKRKAELSARRFMLTGNAEDKADALDALMESWMAEEYDLSTFDLIPAPRSSQEDRRRQVLAMELIERSTDVPHA